MPTESKSAARKLRRVPEEVLSPQQARDVIPSIAVARAAMGNYGPGDRIAAIDAARSSSAVAKVVEHLGPLKGKGLDLAIGLLESVAESATDEPVTAIDAALRAVRRAMRDLAGDDVPLGTHGQERLWTLLAGRAGTAKKLAADPDLDTSEETVRQWVRDLRRAGRVIENRRGRGYWRPDAPPT